MFSWCTLWHFSEENLLMANQPSGTPKATEFREITQNKGHYAVQDHSRSPILVPIKSPYATSYKWLIITYLLSCTISKLWLIIGQIFASDRRSLHFKALVGGNSREYRSVEFLVKHYKHEYVFNKNWWKTTKHFSMWKNGATLGPWPLVPRTICTWYNQ